MIQKNKAVNTGERSWSDELANSVPASKYFSPKSLKCFKHF